jgi:hypothetical protein
MFCAKGRRRPGGLHHCFVSLVKSGCIMTSTLRTGLYVAAMVALIVAVDVLFFRHRFWERLLVNVGIVLVFAAFYLRFLSRK